MNALEKRLKDAAGMGSKYADRVKRYLAKIGSKGGKAKTSAKSAAAIANGKLGGRPKSKKRVARRHNDKITDAGTKTL